MGPFNQIQKMFAATRVIATLIVLVSVTMTLVAALVVSGINDPIQIELLKGESSEICGLVPGYHFLLL